MTACTSTAILRGVVVFDASLRNEHVVAPLWLPFHMAEGGVDGPRGDLPVVLLPAYIA